MTNSPEKSVLKEETMMLVHHASILSSDTAWGTEDILNESLREFLPLGPLWHLMLVPTARRRFVSSASFSPNPLSRSCGCEGFHRAPRWCHAWHRAAQGGYLLSTLPLFPLSAPCPAHSDLISGPIALSKQLLVSSD